MVLLLRSLARIVALLLLAALALAGLALAIFSIGGDGAISLPALARDLHLPGLFEVVGERLRRLAVTDRPVAWRTAAAGAGAIVLAVLLLAGAFARRRQRLVTLEENEHGRLGARRRPLSQVIATLAQQVHGVTRARVAVRPHWRGHGGRLTISAARSMTANDAQTVELTSQAVAPVAEPFGLRTHVRARVGKGRARLA